MTQEVLSSTSSYCTAARFTIRCDWRVAADLLSDTGTRLTSQALVESSTVLAALLKAASGELEAVCLVGGRYRPEDLRAIADAATATNATELLADVVSGLTVWRMFRRRTDIARPMPAIAVEAREMLQRISHGETIFPTEETADAGRIDSVTERASLHIEPRAMVTFQAERFFGRRADRDDPRRQ